MMKGIVVREERGRKNGKGVGGGRGGCYDLKLHEGKSLKW
jgi:hypothetical protein